jgi:Ras GTPase-activating-like protein IQGAP2/3
MAVEQARAAARGMPQSQSPTEAGYQIESIRSLPFHEVKSRAIEFCMKLERAGKISRNDAYQGLLVSIASDIRQKHHLRKMLRQSLAAMIKAQEDMSVKKIGFEESIKSYHTFIDSSMANLQKG